MLILHLLSEQELYGYQITQAFDERSNGTYTMLEGSLYLILYRLEDNGYITSEVKLAGKRRTRKYYTISETGMEYYRQLLADYDEITLGISKILGRQTETNTNDK